MRTEDKRINREWLYTRKPIDSIEIKVVNRPTHNYECYVNGDLRLRCQYEFTAKAFKDVFLEYKKEQENGREIKKTSV